MATDKPATITVKDVKSLAHVLECRGLSMLSAYGIEENRDLLLAAKAMRALMRNLSDDEELYLMTYPGELTNAQIVEITISDHADGTRLWVHADGLLIARIYRIGRLVIGDRRNKDDPNGGAK